MLFNGKLCEWRSVLRQDFLSLYLNARLKIPALCSAQCHMTKQTRAVSVSASRGRSRAV